VSPHATHHIDQLSSDILEALATVGHLPIESHTPTPTASSHASPCPSTPSSEPSPHRKSGIFHVIETADGIWATTPEYAAKQERGTPQIPANPLFSVAPTDEAFLKASDLTAAQQQGQRQSQSPSAAVQQPDNCPSTSGGQQARDLPQPMGTFNSLTTDFFDTAMSSFVTSTSPPSMFGPSAPDGPCYSPPSQGPSIVVSDDVMGIWGQAPNTAT
jgi:hypothetical protein